MPALKLNEFLGEVLVALSEAQRISDEYSEQLRENDAEPKGLASIPNARFQSVKLSLKFAFAPPPTPPAPDSGKAPPVRVYVETSDLKDLPDKVISTLDLTLGVEDDEVIELPDSSS